MILLAFDDDRFPGFEISPENRFRKRIFQIALDCSAKRPRTVFHVITFVDQEQLGIFANVENDLLLGEALRNLVDFEFDNLHEVIAIERTENNDLIDPVEELGLKVPLGLIENLLFCLSKIVTVDSASGTKAHHSR